MTLNQRLFSQLLFLASVGFLGLGCGKQPTRPVVVFDPCHVDMGQISNSSLEKTISVNYKNVSRIAQKIQNVATTCGCTRWTIDKWELEPGESGQLNLYFDLTKKRGYFSAAATITTVGGMVPSVVETTGYVLDPVSVAPETLTLITNSDCGANAIVVITLDQTFSEWAIESVSSNKECVDVFPLSQMQSVEGQAGARFSQQQWQVSAGCSGEIENAEVTMIFSDGEKFIEKKYSVRLGAGGGVKFIPDKVFVVSKAGGSAVRITAIIPKNETLKHIDVTPIEFQIVEAITVEDRLELRIATDRFESGTIEGVLTLEMTSGQIDQLPLRFLISK